MPGMGDESSEGVADPYAVEPAASDGAGVRALAILICAGAVAVNVLLIVMAFSVPALLWSRPWGVLALGSTAGSVIWPSRRKDWHNGPDNRWLLSVAAWALAFATVGLAMSAIDAATGG